MGIKWQFYSETLINNHFRILFRIILTVLKRLDGQPAKSLWWQKINSGLINRYRYQRNKYIKKPLKAIILETGFIIAESAVIVLRWRFVGSFRSTITTCWVPFAVSRMHMYLSLSIVSLPKVNDSASIPRLASYTCYAYSDINEYVNCVNRMDLQDAVNFNSEY